MTASNTSGKTWSRLDEEITDTNYWVSEVIVSSDPSKRGNKKDFTVVVVDSTREDQSNDGWTVVRKKAHGNRNPVLKRNKRKRKQKETNENKESNVENNSE